MHFCALSVASASQGAKDIPEHTGRQTSLLREEKGEENNIKMNATCLTSNSKRSFGLKGFKGTLVLFRPFLMEGLAFFHYHLPAGILL